MLTVVPTHPMELAKVAPAALRALQALQPTSFTSISSRIAQNHVFPARNAHDYCAVRAAPTRAECAVVPAGVRGRQTLAAKKHSTWSPLTPSSYPNFLQNRPK